MSDNTDKNSSAKSIFIFLVLLIIFLLPLIVAVVLYNKNPHWLHHKTVNKGYLIPANINLQEIKLISDRKTFRTFKNSWFLFYLTEWPCRQICQKDLHTMRQITLALGKYRHRVRYGLIIIKEKKLNIHSFINKDGNLLKYTIAKSQFQKSLSVLNFKNHIDGYFIADPLGKIILYYSNNASGEDIYQDLLRLLTISTTG